MAQRVANMTMFNGGLSADDKLGMKGSFSRGKNLEIRSRASQVSVTPAPGLDSGSTVTGLVLDMCMDTSGNIYMIDDAGKFYKRDTNGDYSIIGVIGDSSGGSLLYRKDNDEILITKQNDIARYWPVSGSPVTATLTQSKYGVSRSEDSSAYRTGGLLTYTIPTAYDEDTATQKLSFTPDIEPLYSMKFVVDTVGTGDLTFVLHDDANNELGEVTVTNANIPASGQLMEIVFSTPVRMLIKPNARTYHVHATSTVADTKLRVATADDFNTADFQIIAPRLIETVNGLHPAVQFLQYNCYGNERYLAVHEPLSDDPTNAEFERHRLTFPSGYEVCGLAVWQEFLAIAVQRTTTSDTKEYQDGYIFFWDGLVTTYNFFIQVPEGAPEALYSHKNYLYWFASGEWWMLPPNSQTPRKLRRMPNTNKPFLDSYQSTRMYPNMMTVKSGILLAGFPGATEEGSIERGIYSYGSLDQSYPEVFNLEHTLETTGGSYENGTNNLRIGCVKNFGEELYVSWRDDQNSPQYGVSSSSPFSYPHTEALFRSLWFDAGSPYKQKMALELVITMKPLPADCTVTPVYRLDRSDDTADEVFGTAKTTEDATIIRMNINKLFYEIMVGFDIDITGNTTPPEITSIALVYDDLSNEGRVG